MVVIALLPKFFPKTLDRALGEESDGWHLTCKKRISVITIKHSAEFCDQHHIRFKVEPQRAAPNAPPLSSGLLSRP
jgi:hypothetical protein